MVSHALSRDSWSHFIPERLLNCFVIENIVCVDQCVNMLPLLQFAPLIYLSVFSPLFFFFGVLYDVVQILRRSNKGYEQEDGIEVLLRYLSISIIQFSVALICNTRNESLSLFELIVLDFLKFNQVLYFEEII